MKVVVLSGSALRSNPASDVSEAGLLDVACALSTDPHWSSVPHAKLIVRLAPYPLLGILGEFDAAAEYRISELRVQLSEPLPRSISYAQAEEDCELLAERLVLRFGLRELRQFHFTGMPRGGLIVLGMLAYRLGLDRSQLEPPLSPELPMVLVDDCALTGFRFGQWLQGADHTDVVFAHLYSHPDLRRAVEESEPRVQACISARDLVDHAPERLSGGYPEWRADRLRRMAPPRYWIGQPEPICFAWSEPDHAFWNPISGQREKSWRLAPPALCLRNRSGVGVSAIPMQLQSELAGSLRPAAHILVAELGDQVVVLDTISERSLVLRDVAADMWKAVLRQPSVSAATAALQKIYPTDAQMIRSDLDTFTQELQARGVLESNIYATRPFA